jgi:phage tail sheath gpL-like
MSVNERPGVYSSYEVSSTLAGRTDGGVAGLAAVAAAGSVGTAVTVTSYTQAVAAFGADCDMAKLIRLLLENGASQVVAVPAAVGGAATTENYAAAFAVLMQDSRVKYMLCGSRDAAVHAAMKTAIAAGGENFKYRIGIVEADGTAAELISAASALNWERMTIVGNAEKDGVPGAVAAAAAGCVAGSRDPALPLNGAVLYGLGELKNSFADGDVNALILGGVTPVESVSGEISVVRGITTRTTTAGEADATWRELTTILIVDSVIPSIRAALRTKFARAKNTAQTRGAIRTQVVIELEDAVAREIIDGYGAVTAAADSADPTICDVSFDFTVAHGLNSIRLTAYITV